MKSILFAAAAMIAVPAIAQDQPPAPTPPGGYQPSGPAIQGTPMPGSPVRFQQAPDPNTAYPPPAAMDHYPICKKGQFDGCMQASDAPRMMHKAMHRKPKHGEKKKP